MTWNDDGYNGRSMSDILNKMNKKAPDRVAAQQPVEPPRFELNQYPPGGVSINILNLVRELEAMNERMRLQEQKERALADMQRQGERARARARAMTEKQKRALDALKSQSPQKQSAPVPSPAPAPKKSAAPLAPGKKFDRKIDWK